VGLPSAARVAWRFHWNLESYRSGRRIAPSSLDNRFFTGVPLFPFGFGLSYTNWSYAFFSEGSSGGAASASEPRIISSAAVTAELYSSGGIASVMGTLASLASTGPAKPLVDYWVRGPR
jgi:hypothetical protein